MVTPGVSTRDQHPEAQLDALSAAGCGRTFTDHASGTLARRPALDEALVLLGVQERGAVLGDGRGEGVDFAELAGEEPPAVVT